MTPPATISQIYAPRASSAHDASDLMADAPTHLAEQFGQFTGQFDQFSQFDTWQTTVAAPASLQGVGLHSGKMIGLTLRPAAADTGIVFVRTDIDNIAEATIPALTSHVCEVVLSSKIGNQHGHVVGTIEHLMAALAMLRLDNVIIEIDGAEVPIMDGSADPFIDLIGQAGIKVLPNARRIMRITQLVRVTAGDSYCELLPDTQCVFEAEIDFESNAIGRQSYRMVLDGNDFDKSVTGARTFCMLSHIEAMREAGLGLGGSMDNAIVVDGDKVLNETGLRSTHEFVQHKLLDAVGDLYLAGLHIVGRYNGYKSGHALHNKLLHALFMQGDAFELIDLASAEKILAAE